MNATVFGTALVLAMLLFGALLLYFIKHIIKRTEKYFLSREESLVFFGVLLMVLSQLLPVFGLGFYIPEVFGVGAGILIADWILNWERIVERYRQAVKE